MSLCYMHHNKPSQRARKCRQNVNVTTWIVKNKMPPTYGLIMQLFFYLIILKYTESGIKFETHFLVQKLNFNVVTSFWSTLYTCKVWTFKKLHQGGWKYLGKRERCILQSHSFLCLITPFYWIDPACISNFDSGNRLECKCTCISCLL